MQSKNKDWFHFNGYGWSRVLLRSGGDYRFEVKIKLTDADSTNVIDISKVLIAQTHHSEVWVHENEIWTHVLPESVYTELQEHYSRDRLNTLLHADLYPLIDWERYNDAGEYWVPLEDCIKLCGAPYHDLEVKLEGSKEVFMTMGQFYEKFHIDVREGYNGVGGYHEANGLDDLLGYITYETMTGKVVMDVRSSNQNFDTIVRFQCHRTKDWQEEFNSGLNKMQAADQINASCLYDLMNLVRRASVYISSFNQ